MLRVCLKTILDNKNLIEYHNKVKILYDNTDIDAIEFALGRGVIIDKEGVVWLWFNRHVGFRCSNSNQSYVGKLPICNQLERILNNAYKQQLNINSR